ncbi:MAG: glutathione S-transferase N-terminal domain-containing protein [Pseudomonadota bacterium]
MAIIANRKSTITLYSSPRDPYCHRTRLALAEKNIAYDVVNVKSEAIPEDLIDLNPYQVLPTLVDRDLVLYDSRIIMEYLDERFPHPSLMPVDPVSRGRTRLMLYRIERDWYSLVPDLDGDDPQRKAEAQRELRDSLISIVPLFGAKAYFMSDEFTVVDCVIAPLLWRLRYWGIELPENAKPIVVYAKRLFERRGFKSALSDAERLFPSL